MAANTCTMPFIVGKRKPNTEEPVYDVKRHLVMQELLRKYEPKPKKDKK